MYSSDHQSVDSVSVLRTIASALLKTAVWSAFLIGEVASSARSRCTVSFMLNLRLRQATFSSRVSVRGALNGEKPAAATDKGRGASLAATSFSLEAAAGGFAPGDGVGCAERESFEAPAAPLRGLPLARRAVCGDGLNVLLALWAGVRATGDFGTG